MILGYTVSIQNLTYDRWAYICREIDTNPSDWWIEEDIYCKAAEGGILIHLLDQMPNDLNGVHATGREYLEVNGDFVTEYEDDLTEVVHRYHFGGSVE